MRKRQEEVTGKPTQYNLQTLEYDWKELPDTHFAVKQAGPRIRDYSAAAAGAPSNRNNANGNRRRGDEGADMKNLLGGGGGDVPSRAGGQDPPRSPQPAPMPSRPIQEDYSAGGQRLVSAVNANAEHQPGAEGSRDRSRDGASGNRAGDRNKLDPALFGGLGEPYAGAGVGYMGNPAYAPPLMQQQQQQPVYVTPWSHEDLKRQVLMNQVEASRSYLHVIR